MVIIICQSILQMPSVIGTIKIHVVQMQKYILWIPNVNHLQHHAHMLSLCSCVGYLVLLIIRIIWITMVQFSKFVKALLQHYGMLVKVWIDFEWILVIGDQQVRAASSIGGIEFGMCMTNLELWKNKDQYITKGLGYELVNDGPDCFNSALPSKCSSILLLFGLIVSFLMWSRDIEAWKLLEVQEFEFWSGRWLDSSKYCIFLIYVLQFRPNRIPSSIKIRNSLSSLFFQTFIWIKYWRILHIHK